MSIEQLARDAGLTVPRRYQVDWDRAEAAVGTRLPADFKEHVYWFGPGRFGDYFFVSVPGVENSNIEFVANMRTEGEDYRSWNAGDQRPPATVPLFPGPGGWLPFLVTWDGCAEAGIGHEGTASVGCDEGMRLARYDPTNEPSGTVPPRAVRRQWGPRGERPGSQVTC
ncbi:SMI1/KNR4 family protein [Streptomyces sp. NBC_00996]|uniref:SMI1/KNR4 family protein n=1 Tax=Streptomyces sp. NBC_00996 TaxID=2903710 RepID=UPI0038682518|nr:SMI1/KNR4 family protein [Streptomyces sp. NBC_00996]